MLRNGIPQPAPLPFNEARRLEFLERYKLWHTPPDAGLDSLTKLAAEHFQVPTALISLVGQDQQWFKSRVGLAACDSSRDVSFCAHAILSSDVLIVPDASKDPRFAHNSLVTGPPWIRFYAGAPLEVDTDVRIGSFCIIDYKPWPNGLTEAQIRFLKELATLAVRIFDQYLNRSVFEASPAPIYVLDLETLSFLNCNSAAASLFGYSRTELEGMSFSDLVADGADCDGPSHQPDGILNRPSKPRKYLAKDGHQILALATSRKILYLGRNAVMSILTDITEITETQERLRSALQAAQAAVQAKRQLLATVSHELRTPLHHIIGMASLLSTTDLSHEQQEYIDTITAAGHHLEAMVGGILEYTRQADRVPSSEVFSPDSVVSAALAKWSPECARKAVALETITRSDVPIQLVGDLEAVTKVLDHLISNAVRFTFIGKITIEVTCIGAGEAKPLLEFRVIDTGIGISGEAASHIFQPFFQEDSSDTRRFGGIGLSLALCKRMIGCLDGSINFVSAKGSGSNFWFRIPVEVCNRTEIETAAEPIAETTQKPS